MENMKQYELTQMKLAKVLKAIEVLSKAVPSEKLSEAKIKLTLKKAEKLSTLYKNRLIELEKIEYLNKF